MGRFIFSQVMLLTMTVSFEHFQGLDDTQPYVLSVTSRGAERNAIGLEEGIGVTVIHAGNLLDEARRQGKEIILFLDKMPLNGIYPESYSLNRDRDELNFFVRHSAAPIALWNHFISARKVNEFFTRKVSISVGIEGQSAIPTLVQGDNGFTLILVKRAWLTICVTIIIILFILFIVLAINSDILRDMGPNPERGRKPYSLAHFQMAVWFFVIMTSWLLLYVVKHTFNTISESLVMQMGISAGTGIGGMTIDAKRSRLARRSLGFMQDILLDGQGVSFHRFQIFAWTMVMVAVFVRQVTTYLTMPEFDSSLLVVMGISSGTYLGFKVTEKPSAPQPPSPPTATTDCKSTD